MKQFSIILIMIACLLSALSHVVNLLEITLGGLEIFTPFSIVYSRFGELTFIMGFVGLYLTAQDNKKIKYLSLAFVLLGFFHFLMIEFGFIAAFGIVSLLIFAIKLASLVAFVYQYKNAEFDALTVKAYIFIGILSTYFIAYTYATFAPTCISCSIPTVSEIILPIFYIIFQIGIYVFFLELYREIFHYKNEYYVNL